MPTSIQYASFLIRLWREGAIGVEDRTAGWHGEDEHIQTGERWEFDTLERMLDFLHLQADDLGAAQSARGGST